MDKTKVQKTEYQAYLAFLSAEAGYVYTDCLVYFCRLWRKKRIWLSKYAMQRYLKTKGYALHSQTVQGIVDIFYQNLASWSEAKKLNDNARMPRRRKRYFAIPYKACAIKREGGKLVLSNGKDALPLVIGWQHDETPKYVTVSYDNGYRVNAVYERKEAKIKKSGVVAAVDLGEIHPAAVNAGDEVIILNGRLTRSKRRYIEKMKGSVKRARSKCKKGSKRDKKLANAQRRQSRKIKNQIKDIEHKQTTELVSALKERSVDTVVIGDVRNLRDTTKIGGKSSQKVHQAPMGRVRRLITYKAQAAGMKVELIGEAYTSQTCPVCGARNKTNSRNYHCKSCGYSYHRDGVGTLNIKSKYLKKYQGCAPVVGDMAPPVGVRFADGRCSLNIKRGPSLSGEALSAQEAA
jgi:putative transposase